MQGLADRESSGKSPRIAITKAALDEAVSMYHTGMTIAAIADRLGIKPVTLGARLRREGLRRRATQRRVTPGTMTVTAVWKGRRAEIEELITRGWTCQQIADKYGVSRQRIHQVFTALGLRAAWAGRPEKAVYRRVTFSLHPADLAELRAVAAAEGMNYRRIINAAVRRELDHRTAMPVAAIGTQERGVRL